MSSLKNAENKSSSINPQKILKDPIGMQWVTYCLTEDQNETKDWFSKKKLFWEDNKEHLKKLGFLSYDTSLMHALDSLTIEKLEDLQGCLLVVKVGSELKPAGPNDIDLAHKLLEEALSDMPGIRVLVTHHLIDFQKISLPKLRRLQSEVLASTHHPDGEKHNPIINDMEL